ncbi:N-acyl-L-amino acid amidohydrolase [Thermogymnomonas acidicola]|uniref:N-acyl-L-amino acid amidohydrolase n=1 Tax=Thermogymnomonas acidicola TaxID=399579 RepID=A0AA37F9N8_9ARCH|nr:amidohydrolase [Thermogymnomonas acidicola]GGM76390.1 N-acyl-L-amino acid amidohydrolase [Thermogymnomonas acidicola]
MTGLYDYAVRMRRYFHENPELSFREHRTAERIERELSSMGLRPVRVAGTGVYADIEGELPGRTVAIRADMDALPVHEDTGLPFSSRNEGVMHACGHDAHMAIALAVARSFAGDRHFRGRVRVFFQPAEESPPGGAVEMIRAGLLDGVDFVLGLHVMSRFPRGTVAVYPGPMMANADQFSVLVRGKGGHGSAPHETVDAIVVASYLVQALQTIVSRNVDPQAAAVVTVGTVRGGDRYNIIAEKVEMTGTVRTLDTGVRDMVRRRMGEVVSGVCRSFGAECSLDYQEGYPVLVNNPDVVRTVEEVASLILGRENVLHPPPDLGGEDFAYYLQRVPGAFFFLGVGNSEKGIVAPQHSAHYDLDEDALAYGIEILRGTALRLMGPQP